MSDKERDIVKAISEAMKKLPESKKEYLIGYADGVAAMAEKKEEKEETE